MQRQRIERRKEQARQRRAAWRRQPHEPGLMGRAVGPAVRRTGAAALLALLAVAVGSYAAQTPPRPRLASSPAEEFSAARAFGHVQQIAAEPHPVGSAAHARVRDYLVGELHRLGLRPTVQRATSVRAPSVAFVENVHARIPGRASTGHVLLVAHYDSVARGPGAADDGAGVAAILEVARALQAGPAPRNHVDLLLTDAEEPGLLGAQAFVDAGLLDPRRSVVLNLEARGTSGAVRMFETSGSNADLVAALAQVDELPVADSATAAGAEALLELVGADTDFTVFRQAGFAGMNFAFADGLVRYHSAQDSPANLDQASLQHHGSTMLTLARIFAAKDLGARSSEELTYFPVLGRLVSYPSGVAAPLALLAAAAFAATVWYARRRGGARLGAVASAAASFPVPLVVTGMLAAAVWWALRQLRPGYTSLVFGATYRPEWYEGGLVLVAVAVTLAWYLALRRRLAAHEVALGVWAWLALFAAAAGFLLPGVAYLVTWPLLAGCAALALALRFGDADPAWRQLGCVAAAFPAVVLLHIDFQMGLAFAAVPLSSVVLVAATAAPLVDLVVPRRTALVPAAAALLAFALLGVGLRVDTFDARHPRQTSLLYLLDADRRQAWWASADPVPAPWTWRYIAGQPRPLEDFPGHWGPSRYRLGPASLVHLSPPDVAVIERKRDGENTLLRLRLTSGGASRLDVFADTTNHAVTAATVDGLSLDPNHEAFQTTEDAPWIWGFMVHGVPADGVDVTLTVRGQGPLPMRVVSRRGELPLTAMPDDLILSPSPEFVSLVSRRFAV